MNAGRELEAVRVVTEVTGAWTPDPWLTLPALSKLCGISEFVLRGYCNAATDPLPHYRMKAPHAVVTKTGKRTTASGRILVKWSEFTAWMQQYRYIPPTTPPRAFDLNDFVESMAVDILAPPPPRPHRESTPRGR